MMHWKFVFKNNVCASIVLGLGIGAAVQRDWLWAAFFLVIGISGSMRIFPSRQSDPIVYGNRIEIPPGTIDLVVTDVTFAGEVNENHAVLPEGSYISINQTKVQEKVKMPNFIDSLLSMRNKKPAGTYQMPAYFECKDCKQHSVINGNGGKMMCPKCGSGHGARVVIGSKPDWFKNV